MNATQDRYRLPQIKASDADRDAVVAALSEHFQAGRLTSGELEERTGRALSARTLGELDELTTDLPASSPAPAGPAVLPQRPGYLALLPLAAVLPQRPGYLALLPLAVPLAALAIVAAVVGTSTGLHAWGVWWVVPVALLIARRVAARRGIRGDFRHH